MTDPQSNSGVSASIEVTQTKIVRHSGSPQNRLAAFVRAFLKTLAKPINQLFPAQRSSAAPAILPGFHAVLDVQISAPGRSAVHLYAETQTTHGKAHLVVDTAQVVPLDEHGDGTPSVKVHPTDDRATGQADIRLVAVDPASPETPVATLGGIQLAQEGTTGILLGIMAALLAFGFTMEIFFSGAPILAVLLIISLGLMFWLSPALTGVQFNPNRLLPLRQRLLSTVWALSGVAIWTIAMAWNIQGEPPLSKLCGEPPDPVDCDIGDVLQDNLTSIAASFGLAGGILLALAPAIRPKALIGRILIVAAVTPLILYDLTLVGNLIGGSVFSFTKGFQIGYPALGWGLAGLGVLGLVIRNRLGGWRVWGIAAALSALCLAAMLHIGMGILAAQLGSIEVEEREFRKDLDRRISFVQSNIEANRDMAIISEIDKQREIRELTRRQEYLKKRRDAIGSPEWRTSTVRGKLGLKDDVRGLPGGLYTPVICMIDSVEECGTGSYGVTMSPELRDLTSTIGLAIVALFLMLCTLAMRLLLLRRRGQRRLLRSAAHVLAVLGVTWALWPLAVMIAPTPPGPMSTIPYGLAPLAVALVWLMVEIGLTRWLAKRRKARATENTAPQDPPAAEPEPN